MVNLNITKGQLISICLFGVFNFFLKPNENKSTWGIIVVKSNSFVPFLEEIDDLKNHFEINWPLAGRQKPFLFKFTYKERKTKTSHFQINYTNLLSATHKVMHYFGMITWPSWKRYILKYSRFLRVQLLGLPKNACYYWQTLNQRKKYSSIVLFLYSGMESIK